MTDPLRAALERAWEVGLRGEFIRLVASVLPSVDDEGNQASDVAEGMAEHFFTALSRAALSQTTKDAVLSLIEDGE